ncbi:MAG: hypothetical protein P8I83_00275 [Paracoccaceae bacterium]|nr:hypothetical protein [Paracoccaceae bacterium]
MKLEDDYFYQKFIEDNFIVDEFSENPRPNGFDNIYSDQQMQRDYEWIVKGLNDLNIHSNNV